MTQEFDRERVAGYLDEITQALELEEPQAEVVRIGQEMLTVAAGDEPTWGGIIWRRARDTDPPEIIARGWVVNRLCKNPMHYGRVAKIKELYTIPGEWSPPYHVEIVPFDLQDGARERKMLELMGVKAPPRVARILVPAE